MMYFNRAVTARLYEANRLIEAFQKHAEIRDFFGGRLPTFPGVDLLALYAPGSDGQPSVIKRLYANSRHRTVHYPEVGKPELRDLLHTCRRYPARMLAGEHNGNLSLENQWVTAVRSIDVLGDLGSPGVLTHLKELSAVLAGASGSWLFANSVMTLVYMHKRGMDSEQLVDDPEAFKLALNQYIATQEPAAKPDI